MNSTKMNTVFHFHYRDGGNYKFATPEYILSGTLSDAQMKNLEELFGDANSLLIPSQINIAFMNACPEFGGLDYETVNEYDWDDEIDHPYHSIKDLSRTNEKPNFNMDIDLFYKICTAGLFKEFNS